MSEGKSNPAHRAEAGAERDFLAIVAAANRPQIPAQLRDDLAKEQVGAQRLDRLCAALIAVAFGRCGVFIDSQALVSVDDICRRMGVAASRRPQIQRFVAVLIEDGWVRSEPGGLRWTGPAWPDPQRIAADAAALESDFPFAAGVGGLLLRCMAALPDVLAGRESPVAVLFASGSVTELEVFYSRFPLLALANAMAARAAARMAEFADGRRLRVLEVGAGTGALTAAVLPALLRAADNGIAEYAYSDLSPSFLAHGRAKFAHCAALRALIFDIDKPPAAQGILEASHDLVLGANVVHATPDVRRALRHLGRSLRPGGHLVLIETVRPSRVADCTVGLFDGWWSFRDPELRAAYPLLDAPRWHALLEEAGFRAEVVPVGQDDGASLASVVVLVAVKL